MSETLAIPVTVPSPETDAHVAVPPEADLARIAARAGAPEALDRLYQDACLIVRGVAQEALEAALAEVGTAPLVAVPQEVTRAQARQVMGATILPDGRSLLKATRALIAGRLEAVDSLPDSDPASIAAEQLNEWWESAATYRRDHSAMVEIAGQFGLTDAQVDALFRTATAVS
ncbi:hypothetical protein RQ831_04030 [Roseomonas gilardii]|uniref:Uncharacterized protein n=1 Tax=Roseomonas gilardii TaxID=257708 RepID=A0ABU3MBQ7_9PROT|nr:hypothetical protein [Roseomonas gilardii]MDT8330210.1 hypothetical protein [Roseomonas gilardii]